MVVVVVVVVVMVVVVVNWRERLEVVKKIKDEYPHCAAYTSWKRINRKKG